MTADSGSNNDKPTGDKKITITDVHTGAKGKIGRIDEQKVLNKGDKGESRTHLEGKRDKQDKGSNQKKQ